MQISASPSNVPSEAPEEMDLSHIADTVQALRAAFDSGRTRPYAYRIKQLDGLLRMLDVEADAICRALHEDLRKPAVEAWGAEVADAAQGIRHVRKHLKKWMKPERATTSLVAMPGKSRIYREPLGVVLIIAPWNYPFSLAVNPLVGAIAAGNTALIKPSEVAPATSALIARLLPQYLDPACFKVLEGGIPETTEVLAQKFDHIFYTGNGTVGRIIMSAAAKHLTPVTLELGGKSPCIVDEHADLDDAARRILWSKLYNCGQTCVAPDYVLAHRAIHDKLLEAFARVIDGFYAGDPKASKDFARIINERHHRRLMGLLRGAGEIVVGGDADESECYIAPTIVKNVSPDAAIMQEEIFGPILPVLAVDSVDAAIRFITARPKPLALYLYSSSAQTFEAVVSRTSSGGMVVNHGFLHLGVPALPFGGVGESGMGAYHGKASFETFSHRKSVLRKPVGLEPSLLYAPYTPRKETWIRRLL